MPVSFRVAKHPAQSFEDYQGYSAASAFSKACPNEETKVDRVLQFSLAPGSDDTSRDLHESIPGLALPNQNGFVATLLDAYTKDRALVIRPDDVWLAILSQFNFFVAARAELLRASFVAHKGKRELVIDCRPKTIDTIDFGDVAREMAGLIEKNVVDPKLRAWAVPSFTTTTANDTTVGAVLLMATLKHYFEYKIMMGGCGIPRVTLEGEKSDWMDILGRLEKLKEYGIETTAWYHLLRPVIARFVSAFDTPNSAANVDFWQRIAHYKPGGSGIGDYYSGWITAFTVFSKTGEWLGPRLRTKVSTAIEPGALTSAQFWGAYAKPDEYGNTDSIGDTSTPEERLILDDTIYHRLRGGAVPPGYGEVDVKLVDYDITPPTEYKCAMVAGTIGTLVSSSGDCTLSASGADDTVQPVGGWWIFTCVDKDVQDKRARKAFEQRRGY